MPFPSQALALHDCPSPNHEPRPAGARVELLILHYTGMATAEAARQRLCDAAAKVSSHYLIDEDGTILRLVSEDHRAWHAGVSCWAGQRDVNSHSIGIELVNPGHEFGYRPFPSVQMATLAALAKDILARHPIPAHGVLGHSDVAPARKADPGELFDWQGLAAQGIGLWPDLAKGAPGTGDSGEPICALGSDGPAVRDLQAKLAAYGYDVPCTGTYDEATAVVVTAFQRHFRPWRIDGQGDAETLARLDNLLKLKDK